MNLKKNRWFIVIFSVLITILLSWSCEKGIAPPEEVQPGGSAPHGISGTVYFQNWPPDSTLIDLRVIVFKYYPPGDIISAVLQGQAQFTDSLRPYHLDSLAYTLILSTIPPGELQYIVVAQQYGGNIQTDWRVVGAYYSGGDSTRPGSVVVPRGVVVGGININVDFLHPPAMN